MKSSQRMDYTRLAEALLERGLVDRDTIQHVLQQTAATGALMPEVLVNEHVVSDWELGRVSCDLYGLPFLSLENYHPAPGLAETFDTQYLNRYCLVPLDRFGSVVTVSMPGLVPSEVLEALAQGRNVRILPVVGSVVSNRNWLRQHLPQAAALPDPSAGSSSSFNLDDDDGSWVNIFDAGDEAVQLELDKGDE